MPKSDFHIPTFVNYDCELCGWCCKQYDITFSEAEYKRLSSHDWGKLEPDMAGQDWCAPYHNRRSPDSYRLRYKPEGGCVFLADDNKCRMHAHVGELAKALGCCVFPFTFVRTPSGVYVGGRFSCRAMAYGRGAPVIHREKQLRKQFELVAQAGHAPQYPDNVIFAGNRTLPWSDYMHLDEAILRILLRDDLALVQRLFALCKFLETLREAKVEKVRGARFKEFVELLEQGLLHEAAREELPPPVRGIRKVMFRQFCFIFQRREGGYYHELGLGGKLKVRLGNLGRAIQFAFGFGAPRLAEFPDKFRLADIAGLKPHTLGPLEELAVSRFLAAKVFGKQYFGKLFYGYSLLDGIAFLLLAAGAVMWYARARALARGAETTNHEDVIESIRYVDFCFGSSPAPGLIIERLRTRILGMGDYPARIALAQYR